MNFDWYDAWPVVALVALIYGASLAATSREWWARRAARRRAHSLCAQDRNDFAGCIQRAALSRAGEKVGKRESESRNSPTCSLSHLPTCGPVPSVVKK